ncbi:hypothetical protein MTR_7g056660 [Medicago truncatula]|uniref:Uncharacterized protein n=1 Tax=Medicago truncatula TaxID=3880 RepID=A0A072U0S4_MEDTR|nr:hypothetical protein MTR_7g056660 [Medicago truncatula]
MAAVISMLNNDAALLSRPSKPAFILMKNTLNPKWHEEYESVSSINNLFILKK